MKLINKIVKIITQKNFRGSDQSFTLSFHIPLDNKCVKIVVTTKKKK